jgi:hypothetical protein
MKTAQDETFLDRFSGVVSLKRETYAALQRDPAASTQALIIVMFLGLANGIAILTTPPDFWTEDVPAEMSGTFDDMTAFFTFDTAERQIMGLAVSIIGGVLSWFISSWLLRLIGNRLAAPGTEPVSSEEMRRLVGWGYAPSLASFLSPVPVVGPILAFAGAIWAFVTGIMALRTAFNVGIGKAILIEILAVFVIFAVVMAILLLVVLILVAAS